MQYRRVEYFTALLISANGFLEVRRLASGARQVEPAGLETMTSH